jgi:hypothetical protein
MDELKIVLVVVSDSNDAVGRASLDCAPLA